MTDQDKRAFELVKTLYKNDYGQPFEMTESQIKIFRAIYERQQPRVQIETYSQFGKTDVVSMAVLTRVSTFPEKWPIIAPSQAKAGIVIGQCIKHLFENEYTREKFKIAKDESLERIRRERSKNKLTFRMADGKGIGEAFILSSESRKKGEDAGDILLGWGAQNLVTDESALIPDRVYDKAIRMLAGHKNSFLCKIGNTLRRNHFLKSHNNPEYLKIKVDIAQGVKEGRITQDRVEELRKDMSPMNFAMLYECKFPPEDMITEGGWMKIMMDEDIDRQIIKEIPYPVGAPVLGVDVSGGGRNYSVVVLKYDNFAQVIFKGKTHNTMDLVSKVIELRTAVRRQTQKKVWVCVDAIGIGRGVYDSLKLQLPGDTIGVIGGEVANNSIEFYNKRAENHWKMRGAILSGLKLIEHNGWQEIKGIRYKYASDRKIKIMSKDEMLIEGIESPDIADALSNCFSAPEQKIEEVFYPTIGQESKDIEVY